MSAYLVIVLLLIPRGDGAPLQQELHQEVVSAPTVELCQRRADAVAKEQRLKHIDTVRKTRGLVVGECRRLGGMT